MGIGARRCSMGSRIGWQDPLVSGVSAFPTEGPGASWPWCPVWGGLGPSVTGMTVLFVSYAWQLHGASVNKGT